MPAWSARNLSAWFSAITAPPASSHEVPCREDADTTMSNRSDAFVGAAGTNARNLGLSQEMTDVTMRSANNDSISTGSLPLGADQAGKCLLQDRFWHRVVERYRVQGQPFAAVTKDGFGHSRFINEHLAASVETAQKVDMALTGHGRQRQDLLVVRGTLVADDR